MNNQAFNAVDQAYRYCEQIIKRHSKSFYYAFSKLPKEKANAVYAIYAFCRLADDCVDSKGTKEEKLQALHILEQRLTLLKQGKKINHPLWRALHDVFDRFDMSIEPFYDQLAGQRMDIDFEIPKTMADLEEYSYFVAGSVGLMLLPILASDKASALKEQAISLGVAMQLTNILRDIGEDYRDKQRIYLPSEEMAHVLYTENDLREAVINAPFIEVWEKLATRAEHLYTEFENSIAEFDEDCRLQVLLSARIYHGILDAVRQSNYNCFSKRNYVSPIAMKQIHQRTIEGTFGNRPASI